VIERLAETGAMTLLPGYGQPWTEDAERAFEETRWAGASIISSGPTSKASALFSGFVLYENVIP
jgi:hypothetical protein